MGASVGSVSVSVVPSAEGFNSTLRDELLPEADKLGEELGQRIKDGIEEQLADIRFEPHADTDEAEADLDHLKEKEEDLSGNFTIGADGEEADAVLDGIREKRDELTDEPAEIPLTADPEEALSAFDIVSDRLARLQADAADIPVDVDDPEAMAKIEALRENLDELETWHDQILINVNDEGADEDLAALSEVIAGFQKQVDSLRGSTDAASGSIGGMGSSAAGAAPPVEALAEAEGTLRDNVAESVPGIEAQTEALTADAVAAGVAEGALAGYAGTVSGAGASATGMEGSLISLRSAMGDAELGDAITVTKTGLNEFAVAEEAAAEEAVKLDGAVGGAGNSLKKLENDSGGGGGEGGHGGLMKGLLAGALAVAPAFIVAASAVGIFAGAAIPDILDIVHHNAEYQASLDQIKSEYMDLAHAVKPEVVTDFDDALVQAKEILPEFASTAEAGGVAVGHMITQIGDFVQSGDTKQFISFVGGEATSNLQAFGNAFQGLGTFVYGATESLDGISKTLLSVAGGLLSFGGEVLQEVPWLGQWAVAVGGAYIAVTKIPPALKAISESDFSQWLAQSEKGLSAFGAAYTAAAGAGDGALAKLQVQSAALESQIAPLSAEADVLTGRIEALDLAAGEGGAELAALEAQLALLDGEVVDLDAGLAALDVEMAATAVEGGVLAGVLGVLAAVNPLVWVAAGVVAVGALVGGLASLGSQSRDVIADLSAEDDATGSNVAGYRKLSDQLSGVSGQQVALKMSTDQVSSAYGRFGAVASPIPGDMQQVSAAQKQAAASALVAAAAQGQVSAATLEANAQTQVYGNHLQQLEQMYGVSTAGAVQLAAGAKVSTSALQDSGEAGEKAMEKIEAYANAGAKGASESVQFATGMSDAANAALSLTTRVQDLTTALNAESGPAATAISNAVGYHQALQTLETDMQASADKAGYLTKAQQATAQQLEVTNAAVIAQSGSVLQTTHSVADALVPLDAFRGELEKIQDPTMAEKDLLAALNAEIDKLKSKSITIGVHIEESSSGVGISVPTGQSGTTTRHMASGGLLPGYGGGDRNLALLEDGETVIDKDRSRQLAPVLRAAGVPGYGDGGLVTSSASFGFPQDVFDFQINVTGPPGGGFGNTGPHSGGGFGFGGGWDPFGSGSSLFGEYRDGASAKTLKDMEDAGHKLAEAFADGSLKTVSEIRDESEKAIETLKEYYSGPAASRLESTIRQQSAEMEKLAAASAKVSQTIANMKQFSAAEVSSLQGDTALSNITGTTNSTTGVTAPVTGSEIASGLQKDLAQLRRFEGVIRELKDKKVAKSLIEQVIAMGPAGGIEYGDAILAGGAALIGQLDKYESEIGTEETVIGHTSAEIQYGQNIDKGWLSSLDKDKEKINQRMRGFGDEIAKELKKALHTHVTITGSGGGHHMHPDDLAAGASSLSSVAGSLTRPDINDIRASLHSVDDHVLDRMTKAQGDTLIALVKGLPKNTGTATGVAVADAIKGIGTKAAQAARASVR
jgi:hypothetical protein